LGVDKSALKFKQKAFGLLSRKVEDVPFLGVLFNSRFFPHTAPEGKELLTVICGGYKQANILQQATDEIHHAIDNSLKTILGLSSSSQLIHAQKWPQGIPQYEIGYGSIKKTIEDFHNQQKNFYIAGNFFGGISVSDCISNARQTARKLA
jgi:oxygen-dependent protoporphyrinogen oxidase